MGRKIENTLNNRLIMYPVCGLIALLLVLGLVSIGVLAEEIHPGNSTMVNCTNETLGEYNITCSECPEYNVTDCEIFENVSICSIDQTIDPGEEFVMHGGVCDITVNAEECTLADTGDVYFPMDIITEQDENGSLKITLDIYDNDNNLYQTWSKNIFRTSTVYQKDQVDFNCPADLTTDVNIGTCAKFFHSYLNESDPRLFPIYELSMGQSGATQALVSCQAQLMTKDNISDYWQAQWEHCDSMFGVLDQEYNNARFELTDWNGTCAQQTREVMSDYNTFKLGVVPAFYMWTTWILVFLLIAGGLFYIWENNKI
jgi:hypothetical protein